MPIKYFPNSTVANPGGWGVTGAASIHAALATDPHDGGIYTSKSVGGAGQSLTVGLATAQDPGVDTGHEIHVWAAQINNLAVSNRLAVRLLQTSTDIDGATFDFSPTGAILHFSMAVPSGSIANISDYSQLRYSFEGVIVLGGFEVRIYQAYLSIPGFEHLVPLDGGLTVAPEASGQILELDGGGFKVRDATEGAGTLILGSSGGFTIR